MVFEFFLNDILNDIWIWFSGIERYFKLPLRVPLSPAETSLTGPMVLNDTEWYSMVISWLFCVRTAATKVLTNMSQQKPPLRPSHELCLLCFRSSSRALASVRSCVRTLACGRCAARTDRRTRRNVRSAVCASARTRTSASNIADGANVSIRMNQVT